jgi:mRNA-degrading endonuclease RelE of RelBE toxin-antitoxin system
MEKKIILARPFKRNIEGFLKKRLLLHDDFEAFQKVLIQDPEMGDVIVGTGGIRKVRLKPASRGKSGGFRVCYYYVKKNIKYISCRYTLKM